MMTVVELISWLIIVCSACGVVIVLELIERSRKNKK